MEDETSFVVTRKMDSYLWENDTFWFYRPLPKWNVRLNGKWTGLTVSCEFLIGAHSDINHSAASTTTWIKTKKEYIIIFPFMMRIANSCSLIFGCACIVKAFSAFVFKSKKFSIFVERTLQRHKNLSQFPIRLSKKNPKTHILSEIICITKRNQI